MESVTQAASTPRGREFGPHIGTIVAVPLAIVWLIVGNPTLAGLALIASLGCLAVACALSPRWNSLAFTTWIFACVAAAFYFPDRVTHYGDFEFKLLIVPLIQFIMFGMGTSLTIRDFVPESNMRKGVIVGVTLQYILMPVLGFLFARLFGLQGEVAVGLILIGSCAGGVASNVITYLAGGNVPLSVTMSAVSTLVAPVATPLAMKLLAGQYVPVDATDMMLSIITMIIVPVVAGVLVNRYASWLVRLIRRWLPLLSMAGICIIIAVTIGLSHRELMSVGVALVGASVMHNAAGLFLGYWGARLLGLNEIDSRTVAIEVGMQNGGMATGIAFDVLNSQIAALASAVFGPWSAITGSLLASYWSCMPRSTIAVQVNNGANLPNDREQIHLAPRVGP